MLYAITLDYKQADTRTLGHIHVEHRAGSPFDRDLRDQFDVDEWFFLGTCNRREFYLATTREIDETQLQMWFEDRFGPADQWLGFQVLKDRQAAGHLFEVTASLASQALGETEIAHQVKQQTASARENKLVGRRLSLLLDIALRAGKRVRGETRIGSQVVSPLSLIQRRMKEELTRIQGRRLVFVGAGDYIRRLIPYFGPANDCLFVNRSPTDLAARYGGRFMDLAAFLKDPPPFDGLISATSSMHALFSAEWLYERSEAHPLVCFDAATPPDLGLNQSASPKLTLLTLADLDEPLAHNRCERQQDLPLARRIIEEELDAYERQERELSFASVYKAIGAYYRDVPHRLAQKYLFDGLAEGAPVPREAVEQFLQLMGKRLATVPILGIRGVAETHGIAGVASAVQAIGVGSELFAGEEVLVRERG